ncbi:hypothetical protein SteCoe_68 [Stentor coeruleus]|uniref:Uncharacterized protein n=1 Tax=Stentor coeruleus TaxID=5963 RepID=A0A1R2D4Z8_9CILI|nr:hypothetical protein SteCoe_68 [Stentor coeruleus]
MSGCPFLLNRKPSKEPFSNNPSPPATDPSLVLSDRSFPIPYKSPYDDLFFKFSLTKSNPLKALDFIYKNSLFHHTYITRYRTQDFLSKAAIVNELRECGNKNYNKSRFDRACLCYEHAFGLFKYAEFSDDETITIVDTPCENDDKPAKNGLIQKLLINYAITLCKMKHFAEAELILQEAQSFVNNKEIRVVLLYCKLGNIETQYQDLCEFFPLLSGVLAIDKKYAELRKGFEQTIFKMQQDKCQLFSMFFAEFTTDVTIKAKNNFDLELNVIQKLDEKYMKMIVFYKDTETYAKVLSEREEVQRISIEMHKLKGIKPTDNDEIMLSHAKSAGIDLSLQLNQLRFESAKRSLISKCFNKGNFNRKLLYQCIQEVMNDYEEVTEIQDKADEEYTFWMRSVICSVILAIIVYLTTAQSF